MSDNIYSIDDILKEINENKIDPKELEKYAAEYGKFDTTALLDDILGRDNILNDLPGLETGEDDPNISTDDLLDEILSGRLNEVLAEKTQRAENAKPQPKPPQEKSALPEKNTIQPDGTPSTPLKQEPILFTKELEMTGTLPVKPLRPLSQQPEGDHTAPLQNTPAMAQSSKFEVHRDSVTRMISKVEILEEIERQAKQKEKQTDEDDAGPFVPLKPGQTLFDLQPGPEPKIEIKKEPESPKPQPVVPKREQALKGSRPELELEFKAETFHSAPDRSPVRESRKEAVKEDRKPPASTEPMTIELETDGISKIEPPTLEIETPRMAGSRKTAEPARSPSTQPVVQKKDDKEVPPLPEQKPELEPSMRIELEKVSTLSNTEEHTKPEKPKKLANDEQEPAKKTPEMNTAQLKYIALRKNRENVVKDFELESGFDDTGKLKNNGKSSTVMTELEKSDISINTTPGAKPSELFHSFDDSGQVDAEGDAPKDEVPDSKPSDDRTIRLWDEKARQNKQASDEIQNDEDEFVSSSQADEINDLLIETKHNLLFRFSASLVVFLLTLGITVLNSSLVTAPGPIPLLNAAENPMVFCAVNAALLVLLVIAGYDILRDGVSSLLQKKTNRTTIYSLAMIAMIIFCGVIFTAPDFVSTKNVHLYTPLLSLCMTALYAGRLSGINRVLANFRFVSGELDKYAADIVDNSILAEDLTRGALNDYPRLVCNRKTPFLSDFMTESFSEDITDKHSRYLVLIVSIISLIVAGASFGLGGDIYSALTTFTGVMVIGAGASTLFVVNRPLRQANLLLSRLGGVVLGYNATDAYSDVNSVLINASDLFESDDVTLYGIKTFSNMAIDRAILDATSVLCETKSILGSIFMKIISDRKDYLDPVDTVIYEDGMGISAWIKDRRVLIGSRELMINHNIDVPSKDYEERYIAKDRSLIYLSAAGELSAVFVVGITSNDDKRNILVDLYNNSMTCIIKSVDPILTKKQLGSVFEMPEDAFRVIPSRLHKETESLMDSENSVNGAVSDNGTFPAYIYSIMAAKRLGKPIFLSTLLNYVSIGVGMLLFIAFTVIPDAVSQLSNLTLCAYEVIWLILILIAQRFNRLLP